MYESFATVWEAIADAIPDATAVVQGDRRVRWRELEDHAARLAAGLSAEGIGRGHTRRAVPLQLPRVHGVPVRLLEAARAVGERELPVRVG